MASGIRAVDTWPPYAVTTRNVSINSENKIHDDAEAKRYGFRGGLVPGTTVYAHTTRPLVAQFGEAWLSSHIGELKLLKPAYEGERLRVTVGAAKSGTGTESPLNVRIFNAENAELATLETTLGVKAPPLDALSTIEPERSSGPRIPIQWENVVVGNPLRVLVWEPLPANQEFWCTGVSDDLPIYRAPAAPVHPGLIVQAANHVFSNHYVLNPWIHTGSRIVTRGLLRLGQKIEVRAVPLKRWEHKGHQFVTLYTVMVNAAGPQVEIWHSAIFKVRPAN